MGGGYPVWVKEPNAIWYIKEKRRWLIGLQSNLGDSFGGLQTTSTEACPTSGLTWKYFDFDGRWKDAGDDVKGQQYLTGTCPEEVLDVILNGEAHSAQSSKAGKYTRTGTSGGYPVWVKEPNAIWYIKEKRRWLIGLQSNLGDSFGGLQTTSTEACPTSGLTWKYFDFDGRWKDAGDDVKVQQYITGNV